MQFIFFDKNLWLNVAFIVPKSQNLMHGQAFVYILEFFLKKCESFES